MRSRILLSFSLLAFVVSGCLFVVDDDHSDGPGAGGSVARARIEGRSGVALSGTATFRQMEGGVMIEIEVEHAPPGWHAVHIHEKGDCSAEDGASAGGHFNPAGVAHGSPHAPEHHAGDLGNMEVKADGSGFHALFMPGLTVDAGEFGVVGRAIIVHADADDLVTQPTGAAGGRIGCGVIR